MPDVTLRQLQYFVAVVDTGSVTAAAEAEHVSQAALSMSVAQLESNLGVDLLIRPRSRKVVPTLHGVQFAAHARRVLDSVEEAIEAVREGTGELAGNLRVGCSFTLSPRLIPELLHRMSRDHPLVRVDFTEGGPNEIQEEVRTGRLDLALLYSQQADPGLRWETLSSVQLHLVVPEDHVLASRESVSVEDFIGMDAVFLNIPPTRERLLEQLRTTGHEPTVRFTSGNMQTILSLVARGYGYSLVNSPPQTGDTFDGRKVAYVPIHGLAESNAIVGVTAGQHRLSRRARAALDALKGV
ncbi:LysR family transcriptional regulator [Microbacterium halophytorum]|uniref:LysR family transcriptional regulator n=1 Tax=Microbacterium halophytorum TaxID=2067568 RepID=UPI000CFD4793|nr:LysR family transcriptional regulator [Microbacterium halophytorum]